jgi:type II secretory pathway pseudopilin PulG
MKSQPKRKTGAGFTLIEIAVSLFILTLVISALLGPMAVQIEERQVREAERTMNEMLEALVGYAVSQTVPRLPCPDRTSGGAGGNNDTANDGREDYILGGACQVNDGNIPWVTLGVSATDLWGNRYRYLATSAFTTRASPTMSLTSTGQIRVCASVPTNDTSCAGSTLVADGVPAVIISHGRNGYGGMNGSSNIQIDPSLGSALEQENAGGTWPNSVVSRIRSDVTGNSFDDIVVWLSPNVLFNRLITANKLP